MWVCVCQCAHTPAPLSLSPPALSLFALSASPLFSPPSPTRPTHTPHTGVDQETALLPHRDYCL